MIAFQSPVGAYSPVNPPPDSGYHMIWQEVISFAFAVIMSGVAFAYTGQRFLGRRRQADAGEPNIQDRIAELTRSLAQAATAIRGIESEVNSRAELVTRLRSEHEKYEKLVELKRPEVEAIVQVLDGALERTAKRSWWVSVAINFVFFLLGSGVTLVAALLF